MLWKLSLHEHKQTCIFHEYFSMDINIYTINNWKLPWCQSIECLAKLEHIFTMGYLLCSH